MTSRNTIKLAAHPLGYMDNLQGLYQLCRNTGINYSSLCQLSIVMVEGSTQAVRGSVNEVCCQCILIAAMHACNNFLV